MDLFKPLQLMSKQTVLEQDNGFQLIVSASLAFRLDDASVLLEPDAMKETIEAMGSNPMPDSGMPKPRAEYLVSGSYYAPGGVAVGGDEIKVVFNGREKKLFVFGDRSWQMGIPSQPEKIDELPIDYAHAFGGDGFENNPGGKGYRQEQLPNIEYPDRLVTSPDARVAPAGLSVIDLISAQKRRYQGTYDDSYLGKYYPGYPPDFDWRYFMSAADDQWFEDYFRGDESYEIHKMHRDKPVVSGRLPGYQARAFIDLSDDSSLLELDLNLDTVWLFPAQELGLLIWRSGYRVSDDEASEVKSLLLGYESDKDPVRDQHYYENVYSEFRKNQGDTLDQLSSDALIPLGNRSALEMLQDATLQDSSESEFGKNLNAKAEAAKAQVISQVEEGIANMGSTAVDNMPEEVRKLLDLEKQLKDKTPLQCDADVEAFKNKLDSILPGITAGDLKKLDFKGFNLRKIDEIMREFDSFMQLKQASVKKLVDEQKDVMRELLDKQVTDASKDAGQSLGDVEKLQVLLEEPAEPPLAPIPRVNAEAILAEIEQESQVPFDALQDLKNLQAMGVDEASIQQLENALNSSNSEKEVIGRERLDHAEQAFKAMYIQGAHYQPTGKPPHKNSLEERKAEFLDAINHNKPVRDQDWAGIDLSGQTLDGVDLSGAYLEQVDLSGASLRNAKLDGAILARATLDKADFSDSSMKAVNIGAVSANGTCFDRCDLREARLSKGNFDYATFVSANLAGIECLEISINFGNFSSAIFVNFRLIEISCEAVNFNGADLRQAAFLQSAFSRANFSDSKLAGSTWADCDLSEVRFDRAEMTAACFAASDPETAKIEQSSFVEAILERANFQSIEMQRSDLSSACIEAANFSETNLYGAKLNGAKARGCLFRKANLRNAVMDGIDLREGSLAKTFLTGASLVGANLFAVDFLRATYGETDFHGCNLDRTILQNWRPS